MAVFVRVSERTNERTSKPVSERVSRDRLGGIIFASNIGFFLRFVNANEGTSERASERGVNERTNIMSSPRLDWVNSVRSSVGAVVVVVVVSSCLCRLCLCVCVRFFVFFCSMLTWLSPSACLPDCLNNHSNNVRASG